jgi:pyrroline-5-carboxylate reductase
MFIEALADAAVRGGIPRQDAYLLASQTLLGSALMMQETGNHPGALKDMVCSPGGTTIEAVSSLEADGFRAAVMNAVDVCARKAKNMGK